MSRKIMSHDDGVRLIREKFEYKHVGHLRFIDSMEILTKRFRTNKIYANSSQIDYFETKS